MTGRACVSVHTELTSALRRSNRSQAKRVHRHILNDAIVQIFCGKEHNGAKARTRDPQTHISSSMQMYRAVALDRTATAVKRNRSQWAENSGSWPTFLSCSTFLLMLNPA